MFGYITLGSNDLPRGANFYETLLAEIGVRWLWEFDRRNQSIPIYFFLETEIGESKYRYMTDNIRPKPVIEN